MKKKILLLIFIFLTIITASQLNAAYPYNHKWQQKNSEHFKIIFSKEAENQANLLLNFLEYYHKKIAYKAVNPTKKFPIILHNHYGLSNGFVAWLPRRSEFYTLSPSQDHSLVGNNSWLNTLAIHEYRTLHNKN